MQFIFKFRDLSKFVDFLNQLMNNVFNYRNWDTPETFTCINNGKIVIVYRCYWEDICLLELGEVNFSIENNVLTCKITLYKNVLFEKVGIDETLYDIFRKEVNHIINNLQNLQTLADEYELCIF